MVQEKSEAEQTIFARSSAAGKAAVAIYRMSGKKALPMAQSLTGKNNIPTGEAVLALLRDPESDKAIDKGFVLFFRAPNSFTGEDVVELHLHGSPAVEAALVEVMYKAGIRLAQRGEFTRRAFFNGKMDLAQVEGLADLLDAQSEAQRELALAQHRGVLRDAMLSWRAQLHDLLVLLETRIDFTEEDSPELEVRIEKHLNELIESFRLALQDGRKNQHIREGLRLVLLGAPNNGKSSLFNLLHRQERALVSTQAGTTRDLLESEMEIKGRKILLYDMAGIHTASTDAIEQAGMQKARDKASEAEGRLFVVEADRIRPEDKLLLADHACSNDILLANKTDLGTGAIGEWEELAANSGLRFCAMSAKTGSGEKTLRSALHDWVLHKTGNRQSALFSRARHLDACQKTLAHLQNARHHASIMPECAADDVRRILALFAGTMGNWDEEDMLGALFSQFCIGK